ncbi:thiamine pyrophosphokinase [Bacillus tianshenii]|uniref:Thiamine diphosphokinase n=1 Tax=Sutcliffiella tianshenii TaxID=1463404 RepID=A0ABS2NW94_9BACI|nr:thiamine diphosphokinase [Bacillus tianshenii]MBM7618946.1 thiamine pyrophosphokinase [Bacillus tianshenii]
MNIKIVAGGPPENIPAFGADTSETVTWVGVDRGVHYLLEQNIIPSKAFGDFDSVTAAELAEMKRKITDLDLYPSEKDETDTELAVNWAMAQNPASITMFGVTGGRLDHFLGNVQLMLKGIQNGITIEIQDKQNKLILVKPGQYPLKKDKNLPYISFLPISPAVSGITLDGFKYPLKNRNIKWGDTLCISNELDTENGTFSFKDGILMMIRSRDSSHII